MSYKNHILNIKNKAALFALALNFIKRKILPHICSFLNYKETIVIYGARQVGKTTITKILINELKTINSIPEEAVFYFDLEDLEMLELCNQGVDRLIRYIDARTSLLEKRWF
ncbi:hypothetical protein ES695_13055 [Candidatus Atribacteria bacterium 1244-E10-H5-B2]|nr:MAG: hypothetical protein ES695_13055 [Candidatus Atribacteria bacterium 1244-E10-H5-B2]